MKDLLVIDSSAWIFVQNALRLQERRCLIRRRSMDLSVYPVHPVILSKNPPVRQSRDSPTAST